MSTVLHDASPRRDHRPGIGEPAVDHPGLWSVVRRAHHAKLSYPSGPDYRSLIVDYVVDGSSIEVEVQMRDALPGDLDERVVTMEILDDYLSMTVEHLQVVGGVHERVGGEFGVPGGPGRPGVSGRAFTIAVQPMALYGD
jgi:hypothetical protein